MQDIIGAFNQLYDEEILSIERTKGSQNEVYLITTEVYRYIVKKFSNMNLDVLKERYEQLRIGRIWDDHNIRCIQPFSNIFQYNDNYFVIYPFMDGMNLDEGELNLEQIKALARMQARIHLLDIKSNLPCHIKKLDYRNDKIQEIIDKCNSSVEVAEKNLVVCNNDFKPLNIVWNAKQPYIVDLDAVYKNHPTFALVESAYTFCHKGDELNLEYYKEYIEEYKIEYGKELKDIDEAIYGSWNGKIQWLKYLEENRPEDEGIEDLTNQMINYQKYVNDIKKILEM